MDMKITAAVVLSLVAGSAQAVLAPTGRTSCAVGDLTVSATACSGAWVGNNKNQEAGVLAELAAMSGTADWSYAIDLTASGGSTGTLTFEALSGPFAVALKAANGFSLYYFDGSSGPVSSLNYSTAGTAINTIGKAQGLSHASLYLAPVPEPGSTALMLAGLAGVAFVVRRRWSA